MPNDELSQEDIDALLSGGGADDGGDDSFSAADVEALIGGAAPMELSDFGGGEAVGGGGGGGDLGDQAASIDMLYDVELRVRIELGRTHMKVEDILRLHEGSVVSLDKDAGAPVDILVNDRLVATGEVLVLNDFFCVRVTEILDRQDRARMQLA